MIFQPTMDRTPSGLITPILSQSDNLDKTRFGAVGVPGENPHRHGKNVQTPHTVALVGSALFSKL